MNRHPWTFAVLASLAVSCAATTAPAPDKTAAQAVPIYNGVLDPAGKVAYLRTTATNLTAVDLATGEVLWETKDAFLPLGVHGNRVVALGAHPDKGTCAVILDAGQKGKVLRRSDALPQGAWLGEGPSQHSNPRGRVEDGEFVLRWNSSSSPFSGVPQIAMQVTRYHGEAKLDLETGKVKVVSSEVIPPEKDPKNPKPLPPENEPDLKLPELVVKDLEQYQNQGCWPRGATNKPRPFLAGDRLVLVVYEVGKDSQTKLLLRTWDRTSGKAGETKTLAEGKGLTVLGAQGRQLFVGEFGDPKDTTTLVLSLESGERLARVPGEHARSPALLLGDRLYNVGGALEAVDLKTGKVAWSRPIYRYVYTGPYPPSAPRP